MPVGITSRVYCKLYRTNIEVLCCDLAMRLLQLSRLYSLQVFVPLTQGLVGIVGLSRI